MSNMEYHAAELMVYFEKTRFLEVLRVFIMRIGMDRPLCVKHYLRKYLRRIADSVLAKNSFVNLPSEFDLKLFVKSCLNTYRIPIITYDTRGQKVDATKLNEILGKFQQFCRRNGLQYKNKVYLNMLHNLDEALEFENTTSTPTNFVNVINPNIEVEPDLQDILSYYKCTSSSIPVDCEDVPKCVESYVVPAVMYRLKYFSNSMPYDIGAHNVYRVVIIGRRGSGKKTQAKALAKRFNLVYIDMNSLIKTTLQNKDNMAKMLCCSMKDETNFSSSAVTSLLWKRVLQRDALSKGWVVIGFPNCLTELEWLIEKFETPPNRVVVLHCNRTTSLRRLILKWEKIKCQPRNKVNTTIFAEKQFEEYDQCKTEMYKYLKDCKTKTIHVNGSCDICHVKCQMFALLNKGCRPK